MLVTVHSAHSRDMDGVAPPLVDGGNKIFRHVGEGDVIAALFQQRADEAPPDVACADHDCLFHV